MSTPPEGEELTTIGLDPVLWWADSPEWTLPQEELGAEVPIPLDDDLALATASPEAMVAAGEVAP